MLVYLELCKEIIYISLINDDCKISKIYNNIYNIYNFINKIIYYF